MPSEPEKFGKYTVLDRLGKGAFGVVYRCTDADLDRIVAVKVLLAAELAEPDLIERFSREARAAAKLSHPNIVAVFDAGIESGKPYLVMEYVAGQSLDAMMDAKRWDTQSTLQLVYQLADALSYSHDSGVLHRDIKPANVLVDERGRPKLADFGLARLADDARWLSASGDILGTPRYMSPEQALLPSDEVDARADIYSLGAVFYELLTGRPLVDGPTALATLKALTDGTPASLKSLRPDLPDQVITVCERMVAKERTHRFENAGEVMTSIANILNLQGAQSTAIVAFSRFPLDPNSDTTLGVTNSATISKATYETFERGVPSPALQNRDSSNANPLALPIFLVMLLVIGISAWLYQVSQDNGSQESAGPATFDKVNSELLTALTRRSTGLSAIRDDTQYHSQLSEIREELNSLIRRAENDEPLRKLRATIQARNGDYQLAIDDWESVSSDRMDIASRRMLLQTRAVWELLFQSSLTEGALRPILSPSIEGERRHLETLETDDIESKRAKSLSKWLGIILNPPQLEHPTSLEPIDLPKTDPSIADLQTWRSLFAFRQAYYTQYLVSEAPEDEKEDLRNRRDAWDQFAMQSIREGLEVDSHHLGLLFLRSIRWIDKVDWDSADGTPWIDAEKRHRGPFESSFQRFRIAPARLGVETAFGRAVILERLGRHERALDQLNEFVDRGKLSATVTAFWVWLQLNVSQDSNIDTLSATSLLRATDRFREADEPDFGVYFVRSLCKAASGGWKEARQEIRDGKKACKIEDWDLIESDFREWFVSSEQSLAKFQDLTVDALWRLPTPPEVRIAIQKELIESLNDSDWTQQQGLEAQDVSELLASGHFRLAKMAAERDDRDEVLEHLQLCLEQKSETITVQFLKDDSTIQAWNGDDEFQELYLEYSWKEEPD